MSETVAGFFLAYALIVLPLSALFVVLTWIADYGWPWLMRILRRWDR